MGVISEKKIFLLFFFLIQVITHEAGNIAFDARKKKEEKTKKQTKSDRNKTYRMFGPYGSLIPIWDTFARKISLLLNGVLRVFTLIPFLLHENRQLFIAVRLETKATKKERQKEGIGFHVFFFVMESLFVILSTNRPKRLTKYKSDHILISSLN